MFLLPFLGPETAVVLGLVVFAVMFLRSEPRRGDRSWIPLVVLIAYVLVNALPLLMLFSRYLAPALLPLFPQPWDIRWWVYVAPLGAAFLALAVVFVKSMRQKLAPEVPVIPLVRRDWRSFARRRDLVLAGVSLGLLAVTCVAAGSASSANPDGWLAAILTSGAGVATFFGWAYGLPVLVSLVLLALLAYAALHLISARPYLRPETVPADAARRRRISAIILRTSTAASALVLGGAWMLIGSAGIPGPETLFGTGPVVYPTGYSSFAPGFFVLGWIAQVGAISLLLFTASGRRLSPARAEVVQGAQA